MCVENRTMWSRVILIVWLSSMTAAPTLGAEPDALPAELGPRGVLSSARKLQREGQYRSAEKILKAGLAQTVARLDPTQSAGYFELLATIYYESGRYDAALKTGHRCQQALEQVSDPDPGLVIKRQEIAVTLANVHLSLDQPREAMQMLSQALSLPGGARKDSLWQARIQAMQARTAQEMGDIKTAESLWRLVESQARDVLAQTSQGAAASAQQGAAQNILVESLLATKQSRQALEALERVLSQQQADELARSRTWAEMATCYAEIQDDARENQSLVAALKLQSRQQKQKSTAEYADLLDRLGLVCQRQRDDATAERSWTAAAAIYERLSNDREADEQGIAEQVQDFQNLQRIYQRLKQWDKGIQVTQRLLEYREQTRVPDDPSIYRAKSALGAFYSKVDDTARAKPLLQEALAYWRTRTPPWLTELAGTLNNLAEVTRSSGSYTEALEYLEEALPIYQQIYPADDFRVAELYSNLGSALAGKGQYKAAIDHYLRSAEICRKLRGPDAWRADEVLATTLLNTAMLYKSQRQFSEAARYCQEALDIRRRLAPGDDRAALPFYLALATLHLAHDQPQTPTLSVPDDNLRQAVRFTEQARDLCEKNQLMNKPEAATVAQLEGTIHERQGNVDLAKQAWRRALEIARATGRQALEAKSLNYLASAELRSGDLQAADELSHEALKLHALVQAYPNLQFIAYLNRAQVLRLLGRHAEALAVLRQSIDQIEAPRAATVGAESERAEYFSQFVAAFDLLVDWNVQETHYEDALSAAENGRNRTFLDQVRAAGVDFRDSLKGTPDEDLLRQEKEALAAYNNQLIRLRQLRETGLPAAAAEAIQSTASQLESLRLEYARIETAIRGASPSYRNLLGDREVENWSGIQEKVLAPDNLLLLYYLGHVNSHLFVIDGRSGVIERFPLEISPPLAQVFGIEPGPLTRGMAAQLVNANLEFLRKKKYSPRSRGLASQKVVSEKGSIDPRSAPLPALVQARQRIAATEILFPRAAREHIGKLNPEYVIVVPDGALHQLPLEALLLEEEPARYVFDALPAIVYAPSATIMSILGQRQPARAPGPVSLLTVGDPRYQAVASARPRSPEVTTSADYLTLGGQLSRLPFTAEECRKVIGAIQASGSSDIKPLFDAEATEKNVREEIGRRRFVHLATHGLVDQLHENLFGAIALAATPSVVSSLDDGFLSLYEIHNLKLNECELVVLSACETNVGPDRPLEAGSTLARAFLSAGAARVVCSQWSVDDQSTAALIGAFFLRISESLRQGQSPQYARALHEARREVRDNPAWAAPYHWAPFVLIGPAR
jgi:CHAT domain-containing protein/tetratricopeptide (TPR) repeat protein